MGGFRQDPDYVTVLALENYDDETGHAAKAPIFSRRVNQPAQRQTYAESPAEAIRICLDTRGRLDLPVMAGLLGVPVEQVPAEIDGLACLDPASGDWVTAEEYLSGNVRDKLAAARACAWLAWSRFRVVIPVWDRTLPTLIACLDATLRRIGGVQAYALTDNEKTVTVEHVAGVPVRHPEIVIAPTRGRNPP